MSQVYMTAKLNLADGTIIYPQISLDNVVKSISDPTLVTVATLDGSGDVPMSQLPYVTTIENDATDTTIPTAAAVRGLANGLQPMLTAGTGTEIINGSTINAMAVNLNDVVINNVPSNGLYLEVEGNTMSVVAPLAANNSAGVIAGATNGVTIDQGIVKTNLGDGFLIEDSQIVIDDASVETTLQDVRIDEGSTVSPVDDQVVTPGNLRGALSVGQAVDVSCEPSFVYMTSSPSASAFLVEPLVVTGNSGTSTKLIRFESATGHTFPKFAEGLRYLLIADITNNDDTAISFHGNYLQKWLIGDHASIVKNTRQRLACTFVDSRANLYMESSGGIAVNFTVTNWRQYEVTALTDEAIAYIAQLPDPDAFFRATSVYSLRDKYLVKQDMVCPFIPTIGMPDNSDLTVASGLSYKIKYTNDNPHIITADTIPVDGYGWDTHVQMFIKGTSSVVFQQPLILMDTLTPNAGHNLSIKWRNGQALVYVDDTNAGYIVVTASGTDNGSLNFGIVDPGTDYVIFAPALDGATVDAGTAIFGSTATTLTTLNVLGNGTDATTITGTIGATSGKTINFQSLAIDGGTLSGAGTQNLDDVTLLNTTLGNGTMLYDVEIPEGSTVTGDFIRAGDGAVVTGAGIIDMSEAGSNRFINGNAATISGVTTANADYSGNGAVLAAPRGGIVSATDATFQYNHTVSSGGVAYVGSAASACFTSCSFIGNSAVNGGAVAGRYAGGFAEFTSCSFTDNSCTGRGGAVHAIDTATMVFSSCTFSNNSAGVAAKDILVGKATVTVNGCTLSELLCSAGTDSTDVSYVNLAGSNRISTYFKTYNGSHTMDLNIESGTVVDLTGNTYTNVLYAGKGNIAVNGAMTIITSDGTSATLGAVNCNLITNTAKVSGDLSIIPADADPWEATNITFASPLDASAAGTVKLSGTTFTSASLITGQPDRIQLPAATTVSFSGNTNAADTKILEAPVIVVGDDAAAPSGSATVVNAAGTASMVSGIGTYIDKEGDNDFVALSNVTSVNTSAVSGSGSLAVALTGSNKFVRIADGTVGTIGEATDAVDKTVMNNEYEPIIGGTFSLTSATVDEATKTTTILSGGTMSIADIRGGKDSVIDLGGTHVETHNSVVNVSGCLFSGGSNNSPGGAFNVSGGAFTMTGCTLTGNKTESYSGAIHARGAVVRIVSCTITGNTSGSASGKAYTQTSNSTESLFSACYIRDNSGNGGDLYISSGSTTISDCSIGGIGVAGAIILMGSNTLDNLVCGNTAGANVSSGAIFNFYENSSSTPVSAPGGIIVDGGCQVITSAGTTVSIAGGTYTAINNDGTTVPPQE